MPGSWSNLASPQVDDIGRTMVPGEGPFDLPRPAPDGLMTTLDCIEPEGFATSAFQPCAWQSIAAHGDGGAAVGGQKTVTFLPSNDTDLLSTTLDTLDHTTSHLDSLVIAPLSATMPNAPQDLNGTMAMVVAPSCNGPQSMPLGTAGMCAGQGLSQPKSMPPTYGSCLSAEKAIQAPTHLLPPPPPPAAARIDFGSPLPQPAQGACASTASGAPIGFRGCPDDAKLRDAWTTESVLEIYSGSTGRWYVAHVVWVASSGGPDILTLQFYPEEGAKNKALYRNDHQLAPLGVHTAGTMPPGCIVVPSQSRPGQSSFVDASTGVKYETVDQVWKIHLERLGAAAAPQAPQGVNGLAPPTHSPAQPPAQHIPEAFTHMLPHLQAHMGSSAAAVAVAAATAAPREAGGKVALPSFGEQIAPVSQPVPSQCPMVTRPPPPKMVERN